jgi:hypothetical protein
VDRSPYDDRLALVAAKTQIHEIGHSFGAGEADDRSLLEDPSSSSAGTVRSTAAPRTTKRAKA